MPIGFFTNIAQNQLDDYLERAQVAPTIPATVYYGIIVATRGLSGGIRSAAVALGDTVIPQTPNGYIYKCTTANTTGASEPVWPTTAGSTVTDGTAVWTEQSVAMKAGTFTEASYGGYARVAVTPSLTSMSGTQGPGTTTASTGTSGQISNNAAITYGAPTTANGYAFGWFKAFALTAGTIWTYGAETTPLAISAGGSAPTYAISAFVVTPTN
jgi:hypothetical protein